MQKLIISLILMTTVFALLLPDVQAAVTVPDWEGKWISNDQMPELIKNAREREGSRKIAEVIDEKMMSVELRAFRDKFLALKNADEVEKELLFLSNNYASFPLDLKYVAAQLIPARTMRGIVYRFTRLAKKQKITNSVLLTMMKDFTASMRLFLPEQNSTALFDYFTKPFVDHNGSVIRQYETVSEMQNHFGTEVYKAMMVAAVRLEEINLVGQDIIWDNRVFFGAKSYGDGLNRFVHIAESDRLATSASMHAGMNNISIFCAYRLENLFQLMKEQGAQFGVDTLIWSTVNGVSSHDRFNVLGETRITSDKKLAHFSKYKGKYESIFSSQTNADKWLERAFKHLKQSVKYTRLVWEEIKDRPVAEHAVINPAKVNPWGNDIERNLKTMEALIEGPTQLRSAITGETITVDLPAFYGRPIDLKHFLPTEWELGDEFIYTQLAVRGKTEKIKTRNFDRGRPIKWNLDVYKTLIPSLKDSSELPTALKTFSQALSANGTAIPFLGR
ncbi:MAG: hypothetical protein HYV97_08225 [Bdellovibrio sp.]|nr:hypothetical protein [Bdellovibrio sp.]